MEITISGRHVEVTDALKEHAQEQALKLEHYEQQIIKVSMVLKAEPRRHIAEVIVSAKRGHTFTAEAECEDMYTSIDQALEKVERQLEREKGRMKDHRPKRAPSPDVEEDEEDDTGEEEPKDR